MDANILVSQNYHIIPTKVNIIEIYFKNAKCFCSYLVTIF